MRFAPGFQSGGREPFAYFQQVRNRMMKTKNIAPLISCMPLLLRK
jgi:hypothetical protein